MAQGPVVLGFYRGQWCPYCNIELQAVQRRYAEIQSLGASVFFVGPETEESAAAMVEKTEALIPVLFDVDGVVMESFRIAFEQPEALRAVDAEPWNPRTGWRLPIPATYIIGTDQRVAARFIDPDYRYRAEPQAIIDALAALPLHVRTRAG